MKRYLALTGFILSFCAAVPAQEGGGQRVVVPARNTTRPRQLKVSTLQSGVIIRTHAGNDVIVETAGSARTHAAPARRREREREQPPAGMRRIDLPPGGFTVEEDGNVISVKANEMTEGNILVTVPPETSVQVKAIHGPVVVEGVHGDIDVSNTNGPVTLNGISGTIVAETTNGPIRATMDRVDPSKPISFSSTNGPIDVTLPADLKANLKMRSYNGSIWSDFDVKLAGGMPPPPPTPPAPRVPPVPGAKDGKFHWKLDRTVVGTINGGGVEASFSTLNGRIAIKKK